MTDNPSDRVRYPGASAHTGIGVATLRSMVSRKQIPHIRVSGRLVLFSLRDLDEWLVEHHVPTTKAG